MNETQILQRARIEASKRGYTLFRNNCGAYKSPSGHYIKYGVCNPGGADLIGWKSITITQEMVGTKLAVFTGIEVKTPQGKLTNDQENFLHTLKSAGGCALVYRGNNDILDSTT